MAKLRSIMVDPNAVADGVWVPFEGEIKLRIARVSNPKAEKYKRALTQEFLEQNPGKSMSVESAEAIAKKVMARHVLVGWAGIEDDDDKPILYSEAKAFEFLDDPRLVDLYNFVLVMSHERDRFRVSRLEHNVGNSQTTSGGNLSGASTQSSSNDESPKVSVRPRGKTGQSSKKN